MTDTLYIIGAVIKFIGVLLLIFGCALAVRRWPGLIRGQKRKHNIAVLESVRLSPRQSLHLVRTGQKYLLLGATDQSIALISPVELTEEDVQVAPLEPLPPLEFQKVMATMIEKIKPAAASQEE